MMSRNTLNDTRAREQTLIQLQKYKKNAVSLEKNLDILLQTEGLFHPSVQSHLAAIRENYEAILTLSHNFAESIHLDHLLWTSQHKVTELLRNQIRKLESSLKNEPLRFTHDATQTPTVESYNKYVSELKSLLSDLSAFYHDLIDKLKIKYRLPHDYDFEQSNDSSSSLGTRCKIWVHRFLIRLGDLARYFEMCKDKSLRNWSISYSFYSKAAHTWAASGTPHNQMAVLGIYINDEFFAMYHYIRSFAVKFPFATAKHNLELIFKNRKKIEDSKKGLDMAKEGLQSSLSSSELTKRFMTSFVTLNGILFTKSSMEGFDDVLMSLSNHLDSILDVPDSHLEHVFALDQPYGIGTYTNSALVFLQCITALIFSAHNASQSQTDKLSSTYANILQRPKLIRNALIAVFVCMSRLFQRCIRISEPITNPIAPSLLVCLDWIAFSPEILNQSGKYNESESQNQSRFKSISMSFWTQVVDFLNLLESQRKDGMFGDMMDMVERGKEESGEGEQGKKGVKKDLIRIALWEDYELLSFLPLSKCHSSLKFDEWSSKMEGKDANLKKKRVARFLSAGKRICHFFKGSDHGIVYDSMKEVFVLTNEYISLKEKEKEKEKVEMEKGNKDTDTLYGVDLKGLKKGKEMGKSVYESNGGKERNISLVGNEKRVEQNVNGEEEEGEDEEEEEIVFMPSSSKSISMSTSISSTLSPHPFTESSLQSPVPMAASASPPITVSDVEKNESLPPFIPPSSPSPVTSLPWLQLHNSITNVPPLTSFESQTSFPFQTYMNEYAHMPIPQTLSSSSLSSIPLGNAYSQWMPPTIPSPSLSPTSTSFAFTNQVAAPSQSYPTSSVFNSIPMSSFLCESSMDSINEHNATGLNSNMQQIHSIPPAPSSSTSVNDSSVRLEDSLAEWLKKADMDASSSSSSVISHPFGYLFSNLNLNWKGNEAEGKNDWHQEETKDIDFASLDDMLTRLQLSARRSSSSPSSSSVSSPPTARTSFTENHSVAANSAENLSTVFKSMSESTTSTESTVSSIPISSIPISSASSSAVSPSEPTPFISFSPMSYPSLSSSSSPKRYIAPPVARAQAIASVSSTSSLSTTVVSQKQPGEKKQEMNYKGFSNARMNRARALEEANKNTQSSSSSSSLSSSTYVLASQEKEESEAFIKPMSASTVPPGFAPFHSSSPINKISIETNTKNKDEKEEKEKEKETKGNVKEEEEIMSFLPDNLNFIDELTDENVKHENARDDLQKNNTDLPPFFSNFREMWGNESSMNVVDPPPFPGMSSTHLLSRSPLHNNQHSLHDLLQSSFSQQQQQQQLQQQKQLELQQQEQQLQQFQQHQVQPDQKLLQQFQQNQLQPDQKQLQQFQQFQQQQLQFQQLQKHQQQLQQYERERMHFQTQNAQNIQNTQNPFLNPSSLSPWNVSSSNNTMNETTSHPFSNIEAMQKLYSWFPPPQNLPSNYDQKQNEYSYQQSFPPPHQMPHQQPPFVSPLPSVPLYPYSNMVQPPNMMPHHQANYSMPPVMSPESMSLWDRAYGPKSSFAP